MAKIRIETEVNASAFNDFYATFQQYGQGLSAQAKAWAALASVSGETSEHFESAAVEAALMAGSMADVLGRTHDFSRASDRTASAWGTLAKNTKNVAGNIASATVSLLKWADVVGIVTGLVGVGGLVLGGFGIDSLARSVGGTRSTSMGVGSSYGGLQSFRTNYSRYGNADSFLGSINEMQTDVTKRLPLGALGIQDWQGQDSSSLGVEFLDRFKRWVTDIPEGTLANQLRNTHLDQAISLQDAQRIKREKPEDFQRTLDNLRRDARSMQVSPEVQSKWQDFVTQLDRAKGQIENVFVTRLVALEPGLQKLSSELATGVAHILREDGPFSHWLQGIGAGLEHFASKMNDPKFESDVEYWIFGFEQTAEHIWDLAKHVSAFLNWIGAAVLFEPDKASSDQLTLAGTPRTKLDSFGSQGTMRGGSGGASIRRGYQGAHSAGKWWTDDRIQHAYDRLTAQGVSPDGAEALIARWAYVESSGQGADAVNSTGHRGIAQWDASRWAKVRGNKDFDSQLSAAGTEAYGSEHAAGEHLLHPKDAHDAAIGSSMFERGEGYNSRTGEDNFTGTVEQAMPKVHAVISKRTSTVTLHKNTGGNPTMNAAAAAAPP